MIMNGYADFGFTVRWYILDLQDQLTWDQSHAALTQRLRVFVWPV